MHAHRSNQRWPGTLIRFYLTTVHTWFCCCVAIVKLHGKQSIWALTALTTSRLMNEHILNLDITLGLVIAKIELVRGDARERSLRIANVCVAVRGGDRSRYKRSQARMALLLLSTHDLVLVSATHIWTVRWNVDSLDGRQVLIHHVIVFLCHCSQVRSILTQVSLLVRLGDQVLLRLVLGERRQWAISLSIAHLVSVLTNHELLILNRDVTSLWNAVVLIALVRLECRFW